ncbi:hypothetical protein BVRB_8g196010 [Beta vulgaris subsp. vulgaris]|nr:hypothetical protein BVRB_8g196010 [Beta vulgaris subsp. vulgaris]
MQNLHRRSANHVRLVAGSVGEIVEQESSGVLWDTSARVRVIVDISKPLRRVQKISLGRSEALIEIKYERLPTFCYVCGRIGHIERDCLELGEEERGEERQWGSWLRASPRRGRQKIEEEAKKFLSCARNISFESPRPDSQVGKGSFSAVLEQRVEAVVFSPELVSAKVPIATMEGLVSPHVSFPKVLTDALGLRGGSDISCLENSGFPSATGEGVRAHLSTPNLSRRDKEGGGGVITGGDGGEGEVGVNNGMHEGPQGVSGVLSGDIAPPNGAGSFLAEVDSTLLRCVNRNVSFPMVASFEVGKGGGIKGGKKGRGGKKIVGREFQKQRRGGGICKDEGRCDKRKMGDDMVVDDEKDGLEGGDAVFVEEERQAVLDIPLPQSWRGDSCYWWPTSDGIYTVRSGYWLGRMGKLRTWELFHGDGDRDIWSLVWKVDGPPKLRHFLWRACKGSLGTMSVLYRRHIRSSSRCPVCGVVDETIMHTLFECKSAVDIWRQWEMSSVLVAAPTGSFAQRFMWLAAKLDTTQLASFASLVWAAWFCRNKQSNLLILEYEGIKWAILNWHAR